MIAWLTNVREEGETVVGATTWKSPFLPSAVVHSSTILLGFCSAETRNVCLAATVRHPFILAYSISHTTWAGPIGIFYFDAGGLTNEHLSHEKSFLRYNSISPSLRLEGVSFS